MKVFMVKPAENPSTKPEVSQYIIARSRSRNYVRGRPPSPVLPSSSLPLRSRAP